MDHTPASSAKAQREACSGMDGDIGVLHSYCLVPSMASAQMGLWKYLGETR